MSLENKKTRFFWFSGKKPKNSRKTKTKKNLEKNKKNKKNEPNDSPQNFVFFGFLVFSRFFLVSGPKPKKPWVYLVFWQKKPKKTRGKPKKNKKRLEKTKNMSQTQDSPHNFVFFWFFGFLEVFFGFRAKTKTALGLFGFLIKTKKQKNSRKTKKNKKTSRKPKRSGDPPGQEDLLPVHGTCAAGPGTRTASGPAP